MRRGEMTVPTVDAPVTCPVWDVGVPGLLIVEIEVENERCWSVTHAKTGYAVGYSSYRSPEGAAMAVDQLALLADWTLSASELRDHWCELRAAVREATSGGEVPNVGPAGDPGRADVEVRF